ncbi:unnamed protein product [Moneuplotes crassus]|uniref:Uncharacterized protein n=1 Tax=Euplotes crassus TaxID=5936 RepID=A0AAD2CWG5_EUPCR|nr:unnamed protein product [Moneuplotes crassus]
MNKDIKIAKKLTLPPKPPSRFESVLKISDQGIYGKYLSKVASGVTEKTTVTSGFTVVKNEMSAPVIPAKAQRRRVSQPLFLNKARSTTSSEIKSTNDQRIQSLLEKFRKDHKRNTRRSLDINTRRKLPTHRSLSDLKTSLPRKLVKNSSIVVSGDITARIRGKVLFDPTQKNSHKRSSTTPRAISKSKLAKRKDNCGCIIF